MKKVFFLFLLHITISFSAFNQKINDLTGINVRATDLEAPKQRFTWVREFHDWSTDIGFPNPWGDTAARVARLLDPYKPDMWKISWSPSYDQTSIFLNYDEYYSNLKGRVIPVLKGIAPISRGIINYPTGCGPVSPMEQKPLPPNGAYLNNTGNCDLPEEDQIPPRFQQIRAEPWFSHAHWMSLFAAKFGAPSSWDSNFVSQYLVPDHPKRLGLNTVRYFEDNNEPNKTWYDRAVGLNKFGPDDHTLWYFTPQQYAAMFSADYDGHAGMLSVDNRPLGIVNVSPNNKFVMSGLAGLHGKYVEEMKDFWLNAPGDARRPDGSIPEFVANFHHYSNDVTARQQTKEDFFGPLGEYNHYTDILLNVFGKGVSPEADNLRNKLRWMRDTLEAAFGDKITEYWYSEFGYDSYPDPDKNFSGVDVPELKGPNGEIVDVQTVQAQWIIRGVLEIAASKAIDKVMLFELLDHSEFDPSTYAYSGLLTRDGKAKHAWYYMMALKSVMGEHEFSRDILNGEQGFSVSPKGNPVGKTPRVYEFVKGNNRIFAIWSPTHDVTKYSCSISFPANLPLNGQATLVYLEDLCEQGRKVDWSVHVNGQTIEDLPVSETPVFLILNESWTQPNLPPVKYLAATPQCCGAVRLSWHTFGNTENTLIFYQKDLTNGQVVPDFRFNQATLHKNNIGPNRSHELVTGLEPNQRYYFWVFPIDRNGQPQLNLMAPASRIAAFTQDCANCLIKVRRDQISADPNYNNFVPQAGKNMVDEASEMFGANDSLLACAKIFDPNPKFTYQGVSGNGFNGWGSEAWINPNPGILQLIPDLNRIFVTFDNPKKIRSLYIQDWFGNGRVTIEYKDCFCKEWKVFKVVELEGVAPGKWIIDTELPPVTVKALRFSKAKSDAVMRQFYFCGEDADCGPKPGKIKPRSTTLNPVYATEIRSHTAALSWAADIADEETEQAVFVQQYEVKIGTAYNAKGELNNPKTLNIKASPQDPLAIVRLDDLAPATTYFAEIRPIPLADPCETHTATPGVKKSMFRTDSVTVRKRKEIARHEEQAHFSLSMTPNPANDFVWVSLSAGDAAHIAVYSADGRLLLDQSVTQVDDMNLDVRHLPAGAYWVRVQRTDGAVRMAFLGRVN
jgi:hypothetical protein